MRRLLFATLPFLLACPWMLADSAGLDRTEKGAGAEDKLPGLAKNVVRRSARVREGDLVHIIGSPKDVRLLEELAIQVRKLGAHPLATLKSDRMERRFYEDVPEKFDQQPPKFELKLAGLVDVLIGVEAREEDALAGVPLERVVNGNKAAEAVSSTLLKRNVRTVWIGNRLYPTPRRARAYGVTEAVLEKTFWDGLLVDYAAMQATGAKLKKTLEAGKRLHVTGPGGTDITFDIRGRSALVSDGVLTPEREKKGGAAVTTWLPAGEVYLVPAANSAEGTVVVGHLLWQGRPVKNLKLTFKAGKLTSLNAESGGHGLQQAYAKQRAGKEQFGVIDFGINPNVKLPAGSKVQTYVASGMLTLTLGTNTWGGGDNDINFGVDCHLPGCTAEVDGVVILDKGNLK